LLVFILPLHLNGQKHWQIDKKKEKNQQTAVAFNPKKKPETVIKDYDKVITKAATDDGLFMVSK
jgi:ribosome-binding protein aMBF1 (putative translation factor)